MTVNELTRTVARELEAVSGEDAYFEAKEIVSFVCGIPLKRLLFHASDVVEELYSDKVRQLVKRRTDREPLQYIIGEWEFYGYPFFVRNGVLIPRQDTETLVETAIQTVNTKRYRNALDLCCGSGCIGITVAKNTGISISLADISEVCTDLAKRNAERNGVTAKIYTGDMFSAVEGETFDLITVNPPYLTDQEMRELQAELKFEPALALYGGTDGLDYYRKIADSFGNHLNPGGTLLLEIGQSEGNGVLSLFPGSELIFDINNKPRVVKVSLE